LTAPWPG